MRLCLKNPISCCALLALIVVAILGLWLHFATPVPPPPEEVRIAILNPKRSAIPTLEGLEHGLAERGYIKDQNLRLITHPYNKTLAAALPDLLAAKPDMLITFTTPATKAARQATTNNGLPILFVMHDPISSGVVDSLAQPGGNASGVQVHGSAAKILDWLRTISPDATHVYVPISYDTMAATQNFRVVADAAKQLGIKLTTVEVKTEPELAEALANIPQDADALYLSHSIFIQTHVPMISDTARQQGIPLVSTHHHPGVTLSYGMDEHQAGLQLARMAHMIIRGTPVSEIPTEVANFSLELDISYIEDIGLEVDDNTLLQANKIRR